MIKIPLWFTLPNVISPFNVLFMGPQAPFGPDRVIFVIGEQTNFWKCNLPMTLHIRQLVDRLVCLSF